MLKCNTDWEISQITNRNAPMILFGFEQQCYDILNYRITADDVKQAELYATKMGMRFPTGLFFELVDEFDGRVKTVLRIKGLPDGTWVPKGTPFAEISNTAEGFGELVTWWEGMFLHAWFPSACATRAREMREYLEKRGESLSRFHSFGFRGHRSLEDAWMCANAWSLFLPGTDDFIVTGSGMIARSIPALAHKVVMNWNNEGQCYLQAITRCSAEGYKAVSIVIDTSSGPYFIENFLMAVQQTAEICGITPIYRPDSGELMEQAIEITKRLGNREYGIIIGDSVSFEQVKEWDRIYGDKFPRPISYGIGAKFYNDLERDTLGWSMKTCFSNGKNRMKKTDMSSKRSILGPVVLEYDKDGMLHMNSTTPESVRGQYRELGLKEPCISEIKDRANRQDCSQKEILVNDALASRMVDFKF